MKQPWNVNILVALLIASSAISALADVFQFTPLNDPGFVSTLPLGINNNGDVVGTAQATNSTVPISFFYSAATGTFTNFSVGTGSSSAVAINDSGQIVGNSSLGPYIGTIGNITNLSIPLPGAGVSGINNAGTIVGSYDNPATGNANGFVDAAGKITKFDIGDAEIEPYTVIEAINNNIAINPFTGAAGQIAGETYGPFFSSLFYTDVSGHLITTPDSSADFSGVNIYGQGSGSFFNRNGTDGENGFIRTGGGRGAQFIVQNANTSSQDTYAGGINDHGQFVGYYSLSNSTSLQGYIASISEFNIAGATPDNPILPNSGTGVPNFVFAKPIDGSWYDPAPTAHGFTYTIDGGASFAQVGSPPASYGFGTVNVVVGGVVVATLNPGQTFAFGSGISTFSLEGINPPANPTNPNAFPTFLNFTGNPADLTISIDVPEPRPFALLVSAMVGLTAFRRPRRC